MLRERSSDRSFAVIQASCTQFRACGDMRYRQFKFSPCVLAIHLLVGQDEKTAVRLTSSTSFFVFICLKQ